MKIAATIFSWLGLVLTAVFGFVFLARGQLVTLRYCNYNGLCANYTEYVSYPLWLWAIWFLYVIIQFFILSGKRLEKISSDNIKNIQITHRLINKYVSCFQFSYFKIKLSNILFITNGLAYFIC